MLSADVHNLEARRNIGNAKDLLHSLVPLAQCFCFYGTERNCQWSSDGADDYEIDNFVADLPESFVLAKDTGELESLRRTLPSGRTLLVLPVCSEAGIRLGILIAVFSRNAGKSSSFNPSSLANILAPAVAVIGDGLYVEQRLQVAESAGSDAEAELKLVYEIDEKIHGTSRSHSSLAQLVGQSGRFLGIAYSVLLIPSKRIRISATHSSWKNVNRKALDKYLINELFQKLEDQRSPVIFEVPAVNGSDRPSEQAYQAMLCPLLDQVGNLEGVLALMCRVSNKPFEESHVRLMSHIVGKVEYVIEQSFDSMTGLMNRGGFEAQLHESMKALSEKDDAHQLIYFDIDNLQLVNDTFGRNAGDEVIKRFAQIIERQLPKNAVATRLTGDDFVILLTHSSADDALELTSKIRNHRHELRYLQGDKSLQVTSSIGISMFDASISEGDALTAARIACDTAKDHGRDRVEVYDTRTFQRKAFFAAKKPSGIFFTARAHRIGL